MKSIVKNVIFLQTEYLIKWDSYPSAQNCWVPIEKCNCNEKIRQYENSQFDIIGEHFFNNRVKKIIFKQTYFAK